MMTISLKRNLSDEDCFNLDDLPQLDLKSEGKFVSKYRSKSSFSKQHSFDPDSCLRNRNSVVECIAWKIIDLAKENSLSGVLSSLHDLNSLDWILPETKQLLERQLRLQSKTRKAKPKAKSEMGKQSQRALFFSRNSVGDAFIDSIFRLDH